jgi:hypothetical protein
MCDSVESLGCKTMGIVHMAHFSALSDVVIPDRCLSSIQPVVWYLGAVSATLLKGDTPSCPCGFEREFMPYQSGYIDRTYHSFQ